MPEGDKEKPVTKEEAFLTLIYASGLDEQEANRMRTAEIEILPKRDKAKKGVVDVKITLNDANQLLRKVWRNLEKACKQEGVNRYQLEATSVMSPVRKKPPTVFTKSRIMAREQLELEQRREREYREEKRENERKEKLQKEDEERAVRQLAEASQEKAEKENEEAVLSEVMNKSERHDDQMIDAEDDSTQKTDMQEDEECEDSEDETHPVQSETDTPRVKKAIWMAQDGFGRCGKGCEGCAAKCDQQGLENCQNCHLNLLKNTSSYGCHNRKACLEPKPKLVKGGTDKGGHQKKPLVKNLSVGNMTKTEKTASPMVQMKIRQFSGKGEEEESRKRDIERSPGESPPEKSKKETKIPGLHKSKGKGRSPSSKHATF